MNREVKIAILNKLSSIMDEADCVVSMSVDISYSEEEVPQISYRIKELIVRKDIEE